MALDCIYVIWDQKPEENGQIISNIPVACRKVSQKLTNEEGQIINNIAAVCRIVSEKVANEEGQIIS